jgi:ribosomal protein S27E
MLAWGLLVVPLTGGFRMENSIRIHEQCSGSINCNYCGETLIPQKGFIYEQDDLNPYLAPCWYCPDCESVTFIQDEVEFNSWAIEYLDGNYIDPLTDSDL